tara:strand:- start:1151 stop:1669 length:519 start_codon:yes stop_codon:yes gene_type:complete
MKDLINHKDLQEHYLFRAMMLMPLRELDIASIQQEKAYCETEDDFAIVNYCNTSEHGRTFSRVVLDDTLHHRWTSFLDIVSRVNCNDKTARNIFQFYRNHNYLEVGQDGNRIIFKASQPMLEVYKRYAKIIFNVESKTMSLYHKSITEYVRNLETPGNDYQVNERNSVITNS